MNNITLGWIFTSPPAIVFYIFMAVWIVAALMVKAARHDNRTSYQIARDEDRLPKQSDQGYQPDWSIQGLNVDAYGQPTSKATGMMIEGEPVLPDWDENGYLWFKGTKTGKYWSSQEVAKMVGMPVPPRRY